VTPIVSDAASGEPVADGLVMLSSASVRVHSSTRLYAWPVILRRAGPAAGCVLAALVMGAATSCINAPETALERLVESRRLAADLLVQFTKAADASNRAVMADTDEASVAFAREAEQSTQAVEKDAAALDPILRGLGYSNETRLLQEFNGRFAEYRALDRKILELAVENTNLKAQRLSFGPAQEAANAFRDSVAAIAALDSTKDTWRVKALAATAIGAVREIQVLQAPHIAEADEAAMTRIEKQMATEEAAARGALANLKTVAQSASRPQLDAATAALDRFMAVNTHIIELSRRNTNVRSLALALGQKRTLTAACEDRLHALQDALAKREFTATR
jgi:hypothetical protein